MSVWPICVFVLFVRQPPRLTRTVPCVPYTTLVRSALRDRAFVDVAQLRSGLTDAVEQTDRTGRAFSGVDQLVLERGRPGVEDEDRRRHSVASLRCGQATGLAVRTSALRGASSLGRSPPHSPSECKDEDGR